MDTKRCSRCKQVLPGSEFYLSKNWKDGFYPSCKPCTRAAKKRSDMKNLTPERRRAYVAAYRKRHPDRVKAQERRRNLKKFGITPEQYDEMLATQGGVCAICLQPPTGAKLMPVDHCHASLENRGILCTNCNTALGLFKDDPIRLASAIDYLRR